MDFGTIEPQAVCNSCYYAITGRTEGDRDDAFTCSGCSATNKKGVSEIAYFMTQ